MTTLRVATAALIAFGVDRLSKVVIVEWLSLASVQKISVWPPYLNFVMAWNKGINFGLLHSFDARWFLVAISIAASLALTVWARKKSDWFTTTATGAVVGGALGNAYDRLVYGAVADYVNVSCCMINNPYSFNVADVLIFGGAALLLLDHEVGRKRIKKEA